MSKKTFFKRIAVTAVAALGFGALSIVPSQAAVTSHSLTIDAATDTITLGDSATATLTHSWVNLGSSMDSVVIRAIVTSSNASTAGTVYLSTTDSYTSAGNTGALNVSPRYSYGGHPAQIRGGIADSVTLAARTGGVGMTSNGTDWTLNMDQSQLFLTSVYGAQRDSITITSGGTDSSTVGTADRSIGSVIQLKLYAPQAAGTYTVSVYTQTSNAGAALASSTVATTWTVVVNAPDRVATAASTVTVRDDSASCSTTQAGGTLEATDSTILTAANGDVTDLTPEATACVRLKNATSTALESFTVSVTGEAWVSDVATARPTTGNGVKSRTFASAASGSAQTVYFYSTGTAGTATATFTTASGLSLGSKTMTFHGDVAKLEIGTALYKVARTAAGAWAGNASAAGAFTVKATDSGGRNVKDVSLATVSSDATVLPGGDTCTDASGYSTDGVYLCQVTSATGSVSGAKATLTIRTLDPARAAGTTSYLTTTYEMTLGGAIASEVVTLDKATYEPGQAMKITVTAKDASGNPVYDGLSGRTFAANKAVGGSFTSLMSVYLSGVSTSEARLSTNPNTVTNTQTIFAPAASGKFVITATGGDAAGTIISATGNVGDDAATSAAAAATDAALEAIDAANAATDAANLAAEAADAATVAAEEARDAADAATAAVEALATEVATLMAALKAQITTLANTVAKIAKKVKA